MAKRGTTTVVPKLRFPEFRHEKEWGTWQLGDVCELYQPETIPSSSFTADGAHLVYGAGGLIGRLDRFNHEHAEVIIGCRGVCGNASLTVPRSWITGNAMVIRQKADNLTKQFVFHLLDAADLSPVISGSAQPQITRQGLRRFSISAPPLAEQQKIADCLTSLDEVIAAQGRKVEALKTHKRGLMQQLFPREGETRPRLRFPEFRSAPEWEEVAIGGMGEVITGSTPDTSQREYYGVDHLFVSPADISDSRFVETTKTNLSEAGFAQARPIKARSVLFVCIGSTIGKVAQNARECATNQQINAVVANSDFSGDFIYCLLDMESERIAGLAGRQAVPIINKTLFSSVKVLAPRFGEQQRIADCLSSLDTQIAAESNQLTALKTHKQGLMQQLFPAPEAASA